MKTSKYFGLIFLLSLNGCDSISSDPNNLKGGIDGNGLVILNSPQIEIPSNQMDEDGYYILFDGVSMKGWRGYNENRIPENWTIEDGNLKINPSASKGINKSYHGDIIFTRKFKNFELSIDWKVSEGGASGISYLVKEIKGMPMYSVSPKYQIIDDRNHQDVKKDSKGLRRSSALSDILAPNIHTSKPCEEWNNTRIRVVDGTVEHFQNGIKVLQYSLLKEDWDKLLAKSSFSREQGPEAYQILSECGGTNQDGYIGLLDMGYEVWFRNIKIKILA